MTAYIVFVALILSIWMLKNSGMEACFLKIWMPFFLFMPFQFWVNIPGLPDPNFMQAAIIPLMYALIQDQMSKGGFRFGLMEALMAAYFSVRIFNDFLGRGYSDAQNYAFWCITVYMGPYFLGSYLIINRRMDIATSKMFVLIFLIFFPMFLYEAKFWVSPVFKILSGFFPSAISGLSIRWGLARTAGSFEHPILACIMIIAVYRLHRWLTWIGEWSYPQTGWLGKFQQLGKSIPLIPKSFATQINIALIFMSLLTISRGPWIGGFAGAAVAMCGNARNRQMALIRTLVILACGGLIAKTALDSYLTPAAGEVLSGEAETMLYRKVMIDKYKEFLYEKTWTGWGLTNVPKIQGMESIDNAFFLMALQHGVLAPALFLCMIIYGIASQLWNGIKSKQLDAPIGFSFAGIYLMCLISFATVYMGAQTEPLIFLLLGWGEGIKARPPEAPPTIFVGDPKGTSPPLAEHVRGEKCRVMI